jgi:hypothetical protein
VLEVLVWRHANLGSNIEVCSDSLSPVFRGEG